MMMEQKIRIPELQMVFDEFICPITRLIMNDPVLGHTDTCFERSAIEQWIDGHGSDPITLQPLQKKDLKPNLTIRGSICKFVQGLTNKQKQRLNYLNVNQVAQLPEKEFEEIKYIRSSPQRKFQKLMKQLEIVKNQLFIQRQQKEWAIRQCQMQKKKAAIDRKKLNAWEHQMEQIKARNLVFQQNIKKKRDQIEASKNQNIVLRNQKENAKISQRKMFQEIKKKDKENQDLNKENLELRQLQKRRCQEIEELQKMLKDCQCGKQKHEKLVVPRYLNVKITPDKQSRGLKEGNWVIDNINSNVFIKNTDGGNWLCSSSLPFDGELVFTIKVIKLTKDIIRIGLMEQGKKGEEERDTRNYIVHLYPNDQKIYRPNEQQTQQQQIKCLCSKSLPKCPFQIEGRPNRQQNMIAWHYDGKQQAKSILPKAWKTNKKSLCAIVYLYYKGDSVEMM